MVALMTFGLLIGQGNRHIKIHTEH